MSMSVLRGGHMHELLSRSELLLLEGRWQGLLQLLSLVLVVHDQGVEEPAAANLELGLSAVLLYLHVAGILAPGDLEELPDLGDLPRHCFVTKGAVGVPLSEPG